MDKYKSYGLHNFRNIPQVVSKLTEEQKSHVEVVGRVLPFRTNNFVVNELINWDNLPSDPMFQLTFPQKDMLTEQHYNEVSKMLYGRVGTEEFNSKVSEIRSTLNPHPGGQMEYNIPTLYDQAVKGIQHKYEDTVLFFPSQGQTCHAYCTFCFRWPQFIGDEESKFKESDTGVLVKYLLNHPEVTDVLFTGGDPLIMNLVNLKKYIDPLLNNNLLKNLNTIRLGTKSISYWPYKFTKDPEADDLLRYFETIIKSGKHLAIMAHFNHPVELEPQSVQNAIKRILETGAQIRTQTPIMNHINNESKIFIKLWNEQVKLGCIPYYMFIARDTGAQNYFAVSLIDALKIFNDSYQNVTGLARTVRGPCMSSAPGKIQILDTLKINNVPLMALKYLRARDKNLVNKIFYAKYDSSSVWIDDLKIYNENLFTNNVY